MKNNFLSVQRGNFLTVQTIIQVREIWRKAFPADEPIEPERKNLFASDIFFTFRRSQKEILSVGRLRPVDINFLGKIYKIQGIADIVSVIERQGYGRVIMQAMYKYLLRRKQTGVGFCNPANNTFYQKCGFKIAKNLTHRFLYKNPNVAKPPFFCIAVITSSC